MSSPSLRSLFPVVELRRDWRYVASARRTMRRSALLYRQTGNRSHLACAVIFRDLLSSFRPSANSL